MGVPYTEGLADPMVEAVELGLADPLEVADPGGGDKANESGGRNGEAPPARVAHSAGGAGPVEVVVPVGWHPQRG